MGTGTPHILLFDTGDAWTGGGTLGDATKGAAVVAAMNAVGYDAMALGVKELGLGPDVLAQRLEEARFATVSANALRRDGREVTQPYVLLDVGDHRLAVLGVTRPPEEPIAGFQVGDPAAAIAKWLPQLRQQAHAVVLLTNLTPDEARTAAGNEPGICLIVAANPTWVLDHAERLAGNGALLVAAERPMERHTGRYVGRLAATLETDGRLTNETWRTISLDDSFADDPEMAALLDSYR